MHAALNKTLAALPDETKVYVSMPSSGPTPLSKLCDDSLLLCVGYLDGKITQTAWARVYEGECSVCNVGAPIGTDQEAAGVRRVQHGDAGQIHDWR